MNSQWEDPLEDEGITLGPEEALAREIQKSKALKVERLQLRDRVEKLEARIRELEAAPRNPDRHVTRQQEAPSQGHFPLSGSKIVLSTRWAFFMLIFNLVALGLLLAFMLRP